MPRISARALLALLLVAAPLAAAKSDDKASSADKKETKKDEEAKKEETKEATKEATKGETKEAKKGEKKEAKKDEGPLSESTLSGLKLRGIGPAVTSGRIADLAIDPTDSKVWWVAAAAGGVWKTTNAGTTWEAVFEGEGAYAIGALAIDPRNPNAVWVGSGENNNQRVVGYGDGVYRTLDAGKTWKKMGLEKSEHIGKILIDPRDSNVVWVAAQGPLWSSGGDRGLYQSTDGGATWKQSLKISDDTGVSDAIFDPRDPDTIYASAHQRRRHVWTLVDGGPDSAIYKTTDGGAHWRKLEKGLPEADLGRIGLAVSPQNPDTVYAIVESVRGKGGFFRSTDRGESWEKRSEHSTTGNYYSEIFADPKQFDRIYSVDTFLQVSDDGGKTFRRLGEKSKHVDNHVIWVDPRDTQHYLVGCDGGLYESFDRGANWRFFENLPVTQFYRVAVDETWPVYQVCGGTQDNYSLCGPSRTLRFQGPANEDWTVTQGGDGFYSAIDPEDSNIVYAEAQYGVLTRFDRKSGENVDIQPQPAADEAPFRWNWDSPVLISPFSHTRLYFAANKLFRSDDRGDSWREVSPDLTRQLDRNRLKVMGRIQSPDAVAKNASTSLYGNIVSLAESSKAEGLLYVGTDDGLIQVSEDGGGDWRKDEKFPGVPEMSYVSRLTASQHSADVVYAAFDNHKMGDFKPYVLRSADRGRSWVSIAGNLPERGTVYSLAEDPLKPSLLFAGTEFGLYVTVDGGRKWTKLSGGLPTIAVKDIAIQKRANDLVLATFGRSFYVLDDYSALRSVDEKALDAAAILFPTAKSWLYVPSTRIGDREKGFFGETYFLADNPPFGAVFTYYLKDAWKSKKKARQDAEKEAVKAKKEIDYPTLDALRAETRQEDAQLLFTISDAKGAVVTKLTAPAEKGIHRLSWDLHYPPADPASKEARPPGAPPRTGPFVGLGAYSVRIDLVADGEVRPLVAAQTFEVDALGNATLPAKDRVAVLAFQQKVARLQRAVMGAESFLGELKSRLGLMRVAIAATPALPPTTDIRAHALELQLEEIGVALSGDDFLRQRDENSPPSVSERVLNVVQASWTTTAEPTKTQLDAYRYASGLFEQELARLRRVAESDLPALDQELEQAGAPYTPGRLPAWKPET